jgi:hypothetical protein
MGAAEGSELVSPATITKPSKLTMTPADILSYQNDMVRKHQFEHLGRMTQIAIGPSESWDPKAFQNDPVIAKWGRFMQLRGRPLPIAFSPDHAMLLVCAPLLNKENRVELPDVPDPSWVAPRWTTEESTGVVERAASKDVAPMVPQRLEDRAESLFESADARGVKQSFFVFSPVVRVTFQPELNESMQPTMWTIVCGFNPAERTHPTLLIERSTGETHFFGGLYSLQGAIGE